VKQEGERAEGAEVNPQLFEVPAELFADPSSQPLRDERFGPLALLIRYNSDEELRAALHITEPALTFSIFGAASDPDAEWLIEFAETKAGRVIMNAYPTGVGVSWSMQHGGPWPSTTSSMTTSVGAASIDRWTRPVTFQNVPAALLPEALRDQNPLAVPQRVDGAR
jgi:NADP-dependent aldehyde dehydrogenase